MTQLELKEIIQYYKTMQLIRFAEETLVDPINHGEIKTPAHLYSGQEAIAAGICTNLNTRDKIFGNHRSHGHYIAKGGDLNEMFAEIFCKESGCSRGRGGSMHLISAEKGVMGIVPIVAGTISLALGSALASKIKNDKDVTVCFFGDGATGEGVLYECLNFASLKKLPIIFVCENNFYSTHLPVSEIRVSNKIYDLAKPFDMQTYQLDGNNIFEIAEVAKNSIEECRNGNGPFFLECLTYRMRGHVGPDDNIQGTRTDIRPKNEIEYWRKKDPILMLKEHIFKSNILTENEVFDIDVEVKLKVKNALKFARESNFPKKINLLKYVYK